MAGMYKADSHSNDAYWAPYFESTADYEWAG